MSTIKVENIRIASEAVSRPVTGVAAAWVNFNGTGTVAIRDSVNVSSLTDNVTGDYSVNFSNSFGNVNYSAIGSAHSGGVSYAFSPNLSFSGSQRAVSSCVFGTANSTTNIDVNIADAVYLGDLA